MIRPILKKSHYLLRTPCRPVENIAEAEPVINDLWDTLGEVQRRYSFQCGSGIAAPQIGEPLRISVVCYEGEEYTLINPKIIGHSVEREPVREGCLSFFDYRGMPLRWVGVTLESLDLQGKVFQLEGEGDFASLLQHQVGHLNGILYDTKLAPGTGLQHFPEMPEMP